MLTEHGVVVQIDYSEIVQRLFCFVLACKNISDVSLGGII